MRRPARPTTGGTPFVHTTGGTPFVHTTGGTPVLLMLALLVAGGGGVLAQDQGQSPPQPQSASQPVSPSQPGSQSQPATQPSSASQHDVSTPESTPLTVDVGFRLSSVDGDRARFERFMDIRESGLNLSLFGSKEGPSWAADYAARNVGYHDQQYDGSITAMGKVLANVSFFQLPLNYGFADDGYVRTPYHGEPRAGRRDAGGRAGGPRDRLDGQPDAGVGLAAARAPDRPRVAPVAVRRGPRLLPDGYRST